jgi:hypothetical protein
VSCKCYAKYKLYLLSYKLLLLSTKCRNCKSVSVESCVSIDILLLDFSKIKLELLKVEAQLVELEQ